jgi:hypothetical protein
MVAALVEAVYNNNPVLDAQQPPEKIGLSTCYWAIWLVWILEDTCLRVWYPGQSWEGMDESNYCQLVLNQSHMKLGRIRDFSIQKTSHRLIEPS